jgi:phospholipase C
MSSSATRANALDHIIVVLFENRSLDHMLGRLYGPGDGKTFEGVIGKHLLRKAWGVGEAFRSHGRAR